jgi:uncharacterized DUF497 family protein
MKFEFDHDKNDILASERGVSFSQIIDIIAENGVLANIPHPNKKRYPNQFMLVVEFNDYTYCVPYVLDNDVAFLKTIFPNRDFMFLLKEKNDEKQ